MVIMRCRSSKCNRLLIVDTRLVDSGGAGPSLTERHAARAS
jgi:hypothetical protein